MKITAFFLLVTCLHISAKGHSQEVSLSVKNAPLKKVFKEISRQTGISILYSEELLRYSFPVSIDVKNAPFTQVLDECLKEQPFVYRLINNTIFLERKIIPPAPDIPPAPEVIFKISGTVKDAATGDPLVGVSVVLKNTPVGTTTDQKGAFTLTMPDGKTDGILVFSLVGYQSREISLNGQTTINVRLEQKEAGLGEVVVTGYGGVKRNEFVGASSVITAKALEQTPMTTIEQGFMGRLPGVQVVQSSGAPGAGVSIRVRGMTSIAGGNEPLYVIDGIPVFNDDVRGLNGISSLNPNDIASVVVLKDAASTAIYGSRAANGVVQITTKEGSRSGKTNIMYSGYVGTQTVRNRLKLMSGSEYIALATDYYNNSTDISDNTRAGILQELKNVGNANTDWQNEVYRTGIQHNHNLSFSGGNADNIYYVSANYSNQDGVVKKTNFERIALRVNLSNKLSERFRLDTRVSLSQSKQNGFMPSEGTNTRNFGKSGVGSTLLAIPTVSVYNAEGKFNSVSPYSYTDPDVENPVAFLTATDHHVLNRVQAVTGLTYRITDNITNVLRTAADYIDRKSDFYSPRALVQLGSQVARLNTSKSTNVLIEDYLNYKKTFGKVDVDVVVGASAQSETMSSVLLEGTGFPTDDLKDNAIQAATVSAVPQTSTSKESLTSFFGRIQLNYAKKYLLSFNARRDGSSVFSENNKYANFGAIGGAWRISEEKFMREGIFNNLKLRASTGSTGNQAIAPYQSLYLASVALTGQGAGTGTNVGLAPNLPNPNLTWETTVQTNLGLDMGILNDKYRFSFDYYIKNTKDLLATVNLPQSSGFSTIVDNVGSVRNKGIEVLVGVDVINNENLRLSVDAQASKNTNVVLKTKDGEDIIIQSEGSQSSNIVREGASLFSFYLPKYIGMGEAGEVYEDVDNNGKINGSDYQIVGTSLPDLVYGVTLDFQYKNVGLVANWQGVSGVYVNNVGQYELTDPRPNLNRLANLREYYPNPSSAIKRQQSSRFIEDASYLRLANIKLSYDPGTKFLGLNNVNLYVSAQNLITITRYSGFDPEVNSFNGNDQRQGVDLAAYPTYKRFTLGVNVSF